MSIRSNFHDLPKEQLTNINNDFYRPCLLPRGIFISKVQFYDLKMPSFNKACHLLGCAYFKGMSGIYMPSSLHLSSSWRTYLVLFVFSVLLVSCCPSGEKRLPVLRFCMADMPC